jgi:hypothetical protein
MDAAIVAVAIVAVVAVAIAVWHIAGGKHQGDNRRQYHGSFHRKPPLIVARPTDGICKSPMPKFRRQTVLRDEKKTKTCKFDLLGT